LETARKLVEIGPRVAGTAESKLARDLIANQLSQASWQPVQQRFMDRRPDGSEAEFVNVVARFTGAQPATKRIILCAHFDTPLVGSVRSEGATNGAAGPAILLEIARVLALDPQLASHVELLFTDGFMPFRQLGPSDGLFGSRFYTQMLRINQRSADFAAALILHNVGGSDFRLHYPPNSNPQIAAAMRSAAFFLGVALEPANRPFLTDHVAFDQAGVPTLSLLDAESPYLNTADDVFQRLSADSLLKIGRLLLYFSDAQFASLNQ
jgi:Zn-dependent M28 family amino/carboxypeptidase